MSYVKILKDIILIVKLTIILSPETIIVILIY